MLFVYYFSNLQFHQKGSSLTDPQKFRLTPGFQRRGSIDLQKNEAQETLIYTVVTTSLLRIGSCITRKKLFIGVFHYADLTPINWNMIYQFSHLRG